jgi:hypothetical protein
MHVAMQMHIHPLVFNAKYVVFHLCIIACSFERNFEKRNGSTHLRQAITRRK